MNSLFIAPPSTLTRLGSRLADRGTTREGAMITAPVMLQTTYCCLLCRIQCLVKPLGSLYVAEVAEVVCVTLIDDGGDEPSIGISFEPNEECPAARHWKEVAEQALENPDAQRDARAALQDAAHDRAIELRTAGRA